MIFHDGNPIIQVLLHGRKIIFLAPFENNITTDAWNIGCSAHTVDVSAWGKMKTNKEILYINAKELLTIYKGLNILCKKVVHLCIQRKL